MPDNYLMYARQSCVTGRRLADYLGVEAGMDDPGRRVDRLIRFGSSDRIQYVPNERTLNRRTSVAQNTDKLESLRIMDDAGVPVPNYSTSRSDLSYPMLARSSNHMQGSDIQLLLQPMDERHGGASADYYTEYVPTAAEYRVHVHEGVAFKVSQKVYTDGDAEEYEPHVRNYENGWTFRNPRREDNVTPQAVAAVNALDLDFGAVDLIVGEDGSVYVLEVNTAPSMDRNTFEQYAERFADFYGMTDVPGMDAVDWGDEDEDEPEPSNSIGDRIRGSIRATY